MLFVLMGPSCTGKSTAASALQKLIGAEVFTGKDYLRLGLNQNMAWQTFSSKLICAASDSDISKSVIYIITEKSDLSRLSGVDGAIKVRFTASADAIRSRFARRMKGNLPPPVEKMLDRQYMAWRDVDADLCVDTTEERPSETIAQAVLDLTSSAKVS